VAEEGGYGGPTRLPRRGIAGSLVVAVLLSMPTFSAHEASAHEIPADVVVRMFVKPEGSRLRVLVRVPLESMRDMEFPTRPPGYLDLSRSDPLLRDAARMWVADYLTLFGNGDALGDGTLAGVRISLPSDPSFSSYETALEHVLGPPLDPSVELVWQQAVMDVLLEYPLGDAGAAVSLAPRLAHLGVRTVTVLHFVLPDGTDRVFRYSGDPGLVRLDPRWYHAAAGFTASGFLHILGGVDHILFLLCLLLPIRRFRVLVSVVTGFTVAHSITLGASALGMAPAGGWFPPLVEALIALSIVFMAIENVLGVGVERRWALAFGFGLVHGFGFSFALRETLQFAGRHLVTSLLAFNVGVEAGQLLLLVAALPLLAFLHRRVGNERLVTVVASVLVGHVAWHWLTERAVTFMAYPLALPTSSPAYLAAVIRGVMLLLIAGGVGWGLRPYLDRWAAGGAGGEAGAD